MEEFNIAKIDIDTFMFHLNDYEFSDNSQITITDNDIIPDSFDSFESAYDYVNLIKNEKYGYFIFKSNDDDNSNMIALCYFSDFDKDSDGNPAWVVKSNPDYMYKLHFHSDFHSGFRVTFKSKTDSSEKIFEFKLPDDKMETFLKYLNNHNDYSVKSEWFHNNKIVK